MSKILVKTSYNWADEIEFPSWEVWDKNELEDAKKIVRDYWDNGGKKFDICVGTNEEVDFRELDDCFGHWCYEGETTITESEAEVLNKLFSGAHGAIPFSRVVENIKRMKNE